MKALLLQNTKSPSPAKRFDLKGCMTEVFETLLLEFCDMSFAIKKGITIVIPLGVGGKISVDFTYRTPSYIQDSLHLY